MKAHDPLQDLSLAFQDVLHRAGLHGALRFLNGRTPHRFTGLYRYHGAVLRSVDLFDQFNPELVRGDDALIGNTFCSLLPRFGGALAFSQASKDERVSHIESLVVSYCGVQLRDEQGAPLGTLCHFDMKPCEARNSDLELLQMLGPLLQRTMMAISLDRD